MSLLKNPVVMKKRKLKTEIDSHVIDEIIDYCSWASLEDISRFIEEAAKFVFRKDKEWKTHSKGLCAE